MFLKFERGLANGLFISSLVALSTLSSAQNIAPIRAQLAQSKAVLAENKTSLPNKSDLKSYRQWKNEKIQDAALKLGVSKTEFDSHRMANANSKSKTEATAVRGLNLEKIELQLRADLMTLETAKDLTVTDYFAGYLSKLTRRSEAVKEIAQKMSSEEVAELMMAYSNSLFGSSPAGLPIQAQQGLGR